MTIITLPKITGKFTDYVWETTGHGHYQTMTHGIFELSVNKCDHGVKFMPKIFVANDCTYIAGHSNGFDTLAEAKAECINLYNGLTIKEVVDTIDSAGISQRIGRQIVSVLDDRVNFVIDEGTMGSICFADIESMDFKWIVSNSIIRVFKKDNSVVMLDSGSKKDHNTGQKYQSWLTANGLSGFGNRTNG